MNKYTNTNFSGIDQLELELLFVIFYLPTQTTDDADRWLENTLSISLPSSIASNALLSPSAPMSLLTIAQQPASDAQLSTPPLSPTPTLSASASGSSSVADAEELSIKASITHQVDIYFKMANIALETDYEINAWEPVAKFYAEQEKVGRIPLICQLARKALSAPVSSVYSERLFSEMGQVYEKKRSRLRPDSAESLLFLHHNMQRFEQYEQEEEFALRAAKRCKSIDYSKFDKLVPLVNRKQREKEADSFEDVAEFLGIYEEEN